jgi:hypothetical protein
MLAPLSRTLRGALLALALVALGPIADAVAAPALKLPAAPSLTTAASTLATGHWQRAACDGQVAITWEHLGSDTNAEARWASPVGGDPSSYMRCSIAFSLDVHWDWPKLCTITEHELGHLNGNAHADDATDLMSPYYVEATPECLRTPMPAGPSALAKASSRAPAAQTRKAKARARARRAR